MLLGRIAQFLAFSSVSLTMILASPRSIRLEAQQCGCCSNAIIGEPCSASNLSEGTFPPGSFTTSGGVTTWSTTVKFIFDCTSDGSSSACALCGSTTFYKVTGGKTKINDAGATSPTYNCGSTNTTSFNIYINTTPGVVYKASVGVNSAPIKLPINCPAAGTANYPPDYTFQFTGQ